MSVVLKSRHKSGDLDTFFQSATGSTVTELLNEHADIIIRSLKAEYRFAKLPESSAKHEDYDQDRKICEKRLTICPDFASSPDFTPRLIDKAMTSRISVAGNQFCTTRNDTHYNAYFANEISDFLKSIGHRQSVIDMGTGEGSGIKGLLSGIENPPRLCAFGLFPAMALADYSKSAQTLLYGRFFDETLNTDFPNARAIVDVCGVTSYDGDQEGALGRYHDILMQSGRVYLHGSINRIDNTVQHDNVRNGLLPILYNPILSRLFDIAIIDGSGYDKNKSISLLLTKK